MHEENRLFKVKDDRRFQVSCDAGEAGRFCGGTDSLSVNVGLRVQREGVEEVWDAVVVLCHEEKDGSLAVRVLVCNPDWDEPLQVASIRSRPSDGSSNLRALRCDLDQGDGRNTDQGGS